MVRVLVLTGFGINCEEESAAAWQLAGAQPDIIHLNALFSGQVELFDYQVVCIPGGFSFGDDLSSGKVLANKIRYKKLPDGQSLFEKLKAFLEAGNYILGICNGFQMLVRLGFLPNTKGLFEQELSLAQNESGHFENRWVHCLANSQSPGPWLKGIGQIDYPVRHGEGRLLADDAEILAKVQALQLNALTYCDAQGKPTNQYPENPNGSSLACAALCDPLGQVFGLMPHPEAYLSLYNHPNWGQMRRQNPDIAEEGLGLQLFINVVQAIEQKQLQLRPIRRALLSVSDKRDLLKLAFALKEINCEIISTGGTRKVLEEAGIESTEISQVTGNPEAFGGRMKTISFQIESALLFDRERDAQEAKELGIEPIDLVACNLYPFAKVLEQGGSFEQLIENIDIGGPTMIRSAAKNFGSVTVLVSPSDYSQCIEELQNYQGQNSLPLRQKLMAKAFNHCADYDALIAQTMDASLGEESLRLHFHKGRSLRYGENSHQEAKVYALSSAENSLHEAEFLHGKALSYNNILDAQAALASIRAYSKGQRAICSVIKHSNPCGLALADTLAEALALAWSGDPISAFGSIIATNSRFDEEAAQFFNLHAKQASERKFVEVLIAPDYSPAALEYLKQHKNLRILRYHVDAKASTELQYRMLDGQLLLQGHDDILHKELRSVTARAWDTEAQKSLIEFGLHALRCIKSNSIVLVEELHGKNYRILGMGAGQPNRLIATKLAIEKAKENLEREGRNTKELAKAILLSDAFFPFADNVELAAKSGVEYIVQPGGSLRDKQVIEMADRYSLAMAFSGIRHFTH